MPAPTWLWPEVGTLPDAEDAINHGKYAAAAVAIFTTIFATLSLFGGSVLGIDAFAYLDALFFAAIAFGVSRKSRAAAVVGLVLYILERVAMGLPSSAAGLILPFIFICMFISGVRGTYAYRRLKQVEQSTASAQPI